MSRKVRCADCGFLNAIGRVSQYILHCNKCGHLSRVRVKGREHVCHGVQGGAEVYCQECGKVLYA